MDLHVDLAEEEVEYLQSIGFTDDIEAVLSEALRKVASDKPANPIVGLSESLAVGVKLVQGWEYE